MHYFAAVLHTLGVNIKERAHEKLEPSERGSITVEQVLWAVAAVAFVALVVAAIRAFITTETGKLG